MYSKKIEHRWQEIAFQMHVHKEEVDKIDAYRVYI